MQPVKPYSEKILIYLIVIIIPLGPLAMDLYFPSMPAMVVGLNTTQTLIQYTLTVYILGLAVSQICYGPLSDRFGRRKVILIGTAIFLFSSIGAALTNSIDTLLLFRFIQGIGFGCGFVVATAIMGDVFTGKTLAKVSSFSSMAYSITPIIAPVIGGYIQQYLGWRANFGLMAIYTFYLILSLWFLLPETHRNLDHNALNWKTIFNTYWNMSKNSHYMSFVVCMTLSYGVMIAFDVIAPFLLQIDLHLTAVEYGQLVLLVGLFYFIGTTANSRLVKHHGIFKLISIGVALQFIASLILIGGVIINWLTVTSIMIPTCLAIFGMGLIFPNSMASALSFYPDKAGRASAHMGSVILVGCTAISIAAARLHFQVSHALAYIYFILSFICAIALYLTYRNTPDAPSFTAPSQ